MMREIISIHAPAKGATTLTLRIFITGQFQSTLPRRERHHEPGTTSEWFEISIHAPAKGATFDARRYAPAGKISIHAPAKGATVEEINDYFPLVDFNPRSREGSDAALWWITRQGRISIHAPAKGATIPSFAVTLVPFDFNPRSREGSDDEWQGRVFKIDDFNPRSREGSDGREPTACVVGNDFNPRSREGSDNSGNGIYYYQAISIHAPAKGATVDSKTGVCRKDYFNPRSREGSDGCMV